MVFVRHVNLTKLQIMIVMMMEFVMLRISAQAKMTLKMRIVMVCLMNVKLMVVQIQQLVIMLYWPRMMMAIVFCQQVVIPAQEKLMVQVQ